MTTRTTLCLLITFCLFSTVQALAVESFEKVPNVPAIPVQEPAAPVPDAQERSSPKPPEQEVPPTPEKVFGFPVGADRMLLDWNQIAGYFETLDRASECIRVQELGKTTQGRPFLLAVISSKENLENLDRYLTIQQSLANPYGLTPEGAKALVDEGKIMVLVSMNIHSTEIASSQESVELAYELATRGDPEVRRILENAIVLLIPSLNPDGLQMVVEWYREHVGTPHEASRMPWLYHPYAGHDNNRDWFMFNLQESRLTAPVLYRDWHPQIVVDQHQMGVSGPRLFLPPYADPVNPNVPSVLMAEVNMLGKHVVADLHEQGFKGVVTGMRFNAFFEGTMSKTPLWHNMVGILTEMASCRVATPLHLPRGSLGRYGPELPRYARVTDFLEPWEGGWWRLRDIIEYEKALTYSVLDLAVTYREKFLMNFYRMNAACIEKGRSSAPFAFLVPPDQHDPGSATEMLERLSLGGVRIFKSRSLVTAAGRACPPGTFVIPLAQPCRSYIMDLMEPQYYPDLKAYPDGPPQPPYDVTGWTLPLQMAVEVIAAAQPLEGRLEPATDFRFRTAPVNRLPATCYVVERRYNNAYLLCNELLKAGGEVCWSHESFTTEEKVYPPGTFVIPDGEGLAAVIEKLSPELALPVLGLRELPGVRGSRTGKPRVGLYRPWSTSMDEGWTRLVLDTFGFTYEALRNEDFQQHEEGETPGETSDEAPDEMQGETPDEIPGERPGDTPVEITSLGDRFDVIILPSMSTTGIMDGRYGGPEEPMEGTALPPEKYRGGIGKEGVKALSAFIKGGGTLVALGDACEFAVDKLRLPVVNALEGLDRKSFYAPGSLLRMILDTGHPLAYGMPEETAIRFTQNPAFRLLPYVKESRAVGYFEDGDPLLSGWLIGPEKLAGKTALAEIPVGEGRVVLYGFRVQSRAQTFGTFKLLFNALYESSAEEVSSLEDI